MEKQQQAHRPPQTTPGHRPAADPTRAPMFLGSRHSCHNLARWALASCVLAACLAPAAAQSSGSVLVVDDRAGAPRLRDADRCADPETAGVDPKVCVLRPKDIVAVITMVAHAPPPSAGIFSSTSDKLDSLLDPTAIFRDPGATVVLRVRGAAAGTRETMRSAIETSTDGSGAVIHARPVETPRDCDAAWDVVRVDMVEGSTNLLAHDRCGGDDDGLDIVEADVLERVAALAGAAPVERAATDDDDAERGSPVGFRFDDLGGVIVEPWRPGEEADDWRWRLARELACLLRRPTPEARVPPYLTELRSAGLAANAHGVGSPEHVAASRLVFAAAASRVSAWRRPASTNAGVESAGAEVPADGEPEVGSAVYVAIACDDETVSPLELGRRGKAPATETARRRMAEGGGDATSAEAQNFRRVATATVTAAFLAVVAFVGILAMGTMTFPRDCLLWPSEKMTVKLD